MAQKPNILDEIKRKGTFSINPDEEYFVREAENAGFNEDQVVKGLTQKRIVSSRTVAVEQGEEEPVKTKKPFDGLTKQEVISKAFKDGVTDIKSLEQLSKIYDMVMGESADENVVKQQTARNLVGDIKRGATLRQVVGHYSVPGGLTVEEIFRLYNTYSPYDEALEDIEDVKQGKFKA